VERVVLNEVHWRKARVQADDSFLLAEFQGWSISCWRCSVRLSLLGPVTDDFFLLRILLLGSVIDNLPIIDIELPDSS